MLGAAGRLASIAICVVAATGCVAPVPPPSRTQHVATASPPASRPPTSLRPSEAPGGEPTGAVVARVEHAVTAVAADGADAWYVRDEGPEGRIGHVTIDAGRPIKAAAGPEPVAIAVGPKAIYVLEGVPDDAPRKGLPRTGVLEELDRTTLRLVASARIPGLPVDVELDGDRVWVGGVTGWIGSVDAHTLERRTAANLTGQGSSVVAVGGGSVWMVNGVVARNLYLVHRIDPASGRDLSTWNVPGVGVFGLIAVGDRVWVGGWHGNDEYVLNPISFDGVPEAPVKVRPVAAMRAAGGSLWVLPTAPADLVRYDEASLARTEPVRIGDDGQDLAISGDHVWAASNDLVALAAAR
jgi:hypothetical protein